MTADATSLTPDRLLLSADEPALADHDLPVFDVVVPTRPGTMDPS